jgi:glycosyltransferase involved in cell wall biosynthesis
MNRSCNRADTIITISQFSKSEIVKYLAVPKEKIVVMPCGVDFEFFRPDYSTEEIQTIKDKYSINSDYILYLGTLEPRKNIEKLIDAYQLLKSRNNDIPKLVIAGRKGWQYNSIFQKVNEYRLINDIIFTGYLSEQDTPVLMKGAHAFVFPSIYEGFGMPPLEAMACGTPVITSNVASLPEVVGDAALLVNPFSVESIAEAIGKIIQDECLRTSLSQKGLIHASSFSWDRSAKIVLDVYNNLLS